MSPFSQRTGWPRRANALSKVAARARSRFGEDLIDLTSSNPTTIGLEHPADLLKALAEPRGLRHTPEPFGHDSARRAVHEHYLRKGIDIPTDRIALVASTSEAYTILFRLLLDPGERVLIPRPSYPLFDFLTDLNDVARVEYRLKFDGSWHLDRESFDAGIAAGAKVVLVVSPNNPTGSVLGRDDRAFVESRAQIHSLIVISDEVFADYLIRGTHRDATFWGLETPHFVLNGLSKSAGLPQLKLGWLAVGGPRSFVDEAAARLEILLDTHLSVAAPVQIALPELLAAGERWQLRLGQRLAANHDRLSSDLSGTPVTVWHADGGWSRLIELPRIKTDEAWAADLAERRGVLVHPGYLFDLAAKACLSVSILAPPDIFAEGVRRIVSEVQAQSV